MTQDVNLDVRGLAAPEPLELCLEALADLESGQRIKMQIDREPYPLYSILERDGFKYESSFEETHYLITIWYE